MQRAGNWTGTARAVLLQSVSRGQWLRVMVILWIVAGASQAQARLLSIGGSLSVNYNRSTTFSETDAGTSSTSIHLLGQQYCGNAFGDFYRLGGYRADLCWLDQVVTLEDADQKNRFNVTDSRLSFNLFPQWSPLSLTGQRIVRRSDLDAAAGGSFTTKDRVDSLGANWILNARRLPRLILNYQQSALKTPTSGDFTTRSASAYTDTTTGVTRVTAGYQFSETETLAGKSRSNGINLDTNSQFTPSVTLTAFGRYTSNRLPENVLAPGVSFFQERSYGASAVYRPLLYWWDGLVAYNYSENPFFNDFRSQAVQGSANLRYNEKTDSSFGARYLRFSVTDSTVNSESADASLNYRPIFGLTTGLGGNAGFTSTNTTGAENTDNLFQQYQYNIQYTRPWQLLQYRASYQIAYGVSDTQPTGFNSRDLGNSVSLGVDNTNTEIVHMSLNSVYSDIQRIADAVKTEQSTYLIQLMADSTYLRNLVLIGDSLGLRTSANYSDTTGFGVEGRVISGEAGANYQTLIGIAASVNYRIENYPKELLLDRQFITGQIQYAAYLITNMNMLATLKDTIEDNRYRSDVNLVEGNLIVNYLIGSLTMSAQFQEVETITSGNKYGTRSFMVRAARAF